MIGQVLRVFTGMVLVLVSIGIVTTSAAPQGMPPEAVRFDPHRLVLRPGERATVRIEGTSLYGLPVLTVIVPDAFQIGESTCSANALVVPPGQSNAAARPEGLNCSGQWVHDANAGTWSIDIAISQATHAPISYNVWLDVEIGAPARLTPGMLYTMTAPMAGSGGDAATLDIEILETSGRSASRRMTPTPSASARSPEDAAAPGTHMRLLPESQSARPGDPVSMVLDIPRLQGVTHVAFMVSAEGMAFTNLPLALVDRSGDFACTPDNLNDPVPPRERALPLGTGEFVLPATLNLLVGASAEPGDRYQVCVELVGFSSTTELFVWNAEAEVWVQ